MKETYQACHLRQIQPINPFINPCIENEDFGSHSSSPRLQEWLSQYDAWVDENQLGQRKHQSPANTTHLLLSFR